MSIMSHVAGWASDAPSPAQLKEFFAQIESERITKNRLQQFLRGDEKKKIYSVIIDYNLTTEQMVAAGKYGEIFDNINFKNFSVKGKGRIKRQLELLFYDKSMRADAILADMDASGFRPATIEELLAFGIKYPKLQRVFPIVALGSVYQCRNGEIGVVCLDNNRYKRTLQLTWVACDWDKHYRYLAVRK